MRIISIYIFLFTVLSVTGQKINNENHLLLNGNWSFADSTEYKNNRWNTLPVPASWNTFTEYADYIGDAWYKKTISIPKDWSNKRIYLKFDAVYDIADVWYNDTYLGQHTGGYTPFEFDITKHAKPGEKGELKVKANNEHVVGAWFQWGGINRDVHLFTKEEVRIIRQKIEPVLDVVTGTSQIKLIVTIENKSDSNKEIKINGILKELKDTGFVLTGWLKGKETTNFSEIITLNSKQTRPWHFDDPQLYNLKTVLSISEKPMDTIHNRFGIRKIDIKPDGFYLNGEKVRMMGYNRVHDHRAYGNTEPKHLVRSDIDMMKRSGANFSRLMHAPSSPELLDYADERGLLLWAEIPMWQTVYRTPMNSENDAKNAPKNFPGTTIREMMERDWNHPSIVGWSPGNELRGEASSYVTAMRPFVKEIDPTRFYANIHDQGFQKTSQGGFKGVESNSVDIIFMNKYRDDSTKIKAVLAQHKSIPNLPIFYSEYGETRSESLNHTQDYSALWERLGKEPYVIGGSHWTFNDYRSYWHKSNPASQNRDWGLVDVWRNPKTFYFQMSKMHWPVHAINATIKNKKATITLEPRSKEEIPSFTLRGYHWSYELQNDKGETIEGNIYDLDTIVPGDSAIIKDITFNSDSGKILVISLLSNNGYTVAENKFDTTTGKELPLPSYPKAKNPEVRKVLPLPNSFMVGVTSKEGDKGLEIKYGTSSGKYTKTISAPVMGAIRVRNLKNGKKYYAKIRRILAQDYSPWSSEFEITPDGGLLPEPPKILGVINGNKHKAVRLKVQEKTTGYELTLSNGNKMELSCVNPGLLIVPKNCISIAVINVNGISKSIKIVK
ncbi:glycosyl hydrolase family 2 [Maribacter vaceletii]|uniref:Glycosyl hydrolase family 2 n=1 Tax=Maribacter vaceletii TaxID=1206816 RepID=A0A495EBS6_9FLAO|nr:glycoside hydrolase family 2 TIM barrel-domain containing protein [Maribacter vaceletii]RKR14338.1 glycosyl hydrolase family 2 [Maribacter vaceletii]